jgi:flagellar assembly protein FliH
LTRIKSANIQLGESFIVPIEQSAHNIKMQEALEKEKEIVLRGEQEAQEIIRRGQVDAEKIIEDAKNQALSEVDAITKQAHDEGFEAGRQEGLEDIKQELSDKITTIDDFAKSNFDIKRNIIKSAHLDIVRLVVEIAQKVCSKSLELDDNILKEITQNAIQTLKDKENITIIVNPDMAEKIYAISDELKEKIPQLSSIKIIEDNSVSPDGTIVESPLSRVDSSVKAQINEISDKLMAKLNSTPNEETENSKQGTEDVQD